jgi:hypothetical protein
MSAANKEQLASAAAALLSRAERPCMFSRREGSSLRLVAPNERLGAGQLEQQLLHILTFQPHMQHLLQEQLAACDPCKSRECMQRSVMPATVTFESFDTAYVAPSLYMLC